MKNRALFDRYMILLGEIFDKEFTKVLVEVYWNILKDVSDNKAEEAFQSVIKTCKFFPRPAEILEFCKADVGAWHIESQSELVVSYLSGSLKFSELSDPITRRLCQGRFSRSRNFELLEKDMRFVVRDFQKAYLDFQDYLSDTGKQLSHEESKKILGEIEDGKYRI